MASKIILKKSSVTARVPLAADVDYGELALNYQDGKLYYKKADNTIDYFTAGTGGSTGVLSVDGQTGAVTAAQLLTAIKTVDGSGSGLDADLLDGQQGTYYLDWTNATNKPSPTITLGTDATGSVTLTSLASGTLNLTLASVGTAGTYTKVTTDAKGRVTSGTTLAASDIPNLDASKITSGTIDAARLPSYVDDVLEAANLAAFPATGESGKIYVALDTNKTYRWSGSAYVYITSGAVDSVAGKTGVVTLNSSDVGLGNVENKSSATIRSEITSLNVTSALGFTPYNSTNPSGYITSNALSPYLLTTTASSTYQPILVSGSNIKTINGSSLLGSGDIIISGGSGGTASGFEQTFLLMGA